MGSTKRKLAGIIAVASVAFALGVSTPASATGDNTCGINPKPAISGQTAHVNGDNFNPGRQLIVEVDLPNGNSDVFISVTADSNGSFHFHEPSIEAGTAGTGSGTVTVRNHNNDTDLCTAAFMVKLGA